MPDARRNASLTAAGVGLIVLLSGAGWLFLSEARPEDISLLHLYWPALALLLGAAAWHASKPKMRELADRKRLAEMARTLTDLQATAGVGIWRWNVADDVVSLDATLASILQVEPVLDRRRWIELVHPAERASAAASLDLLTSAEADLRQRPTLSTRRYLLDDGSIRYLKVSGLQFEHDEQGNVTHVSGLSQDVTSENLLRLQIERDKRSLEAQSRLREHAAEVAGLAFVHFDVSSGIDFVSMDSSASNDLLYDLYGADKLRDSPPERDTWWLDYVHPDDRKRVDKETMVRMQEPGFREVRYRVRLCENPCRYII